MPETPFGLLSLSAEEERTLRLVLQHLRLATATGEPISMLWPQSGGHFLPPIPTGAMMPPTMPAPMTFTSTLSSDHGGTARLSHAQSAADCDQLPVVEDASDEASEPAPPEDANGTDEVILDVLRQASRPIKIACIAQRGKLQFNSHLRTRVRLLVRAGKVTKTSTNLYVLADADTED